jgi:predicted PurR-regulated permease PerM
VSVRSERSASSVAGIIALVFGAAVIAWALYLARHALLIAYVSVLLAIGMGPMVRYVEFAVTLPAWRWRPARWIPITIVYLVLVSAIIVAGVLVVPPLLAQGQDLWSRLPVMVDSAQTFLIEHGVLSHRITLEEAVRSGPASPGEAVGTVATAVTRLVGWILAVVTVLMLTFYLLLESDSLFAAFAWTFPRAERPRVEAAARKISTKVSAWLSGQLMLAAIIGTSAAAGLYLLGVPYFWVLALIAAVGETIPVIGPILSAVPAVLVGFTVSPRTGIFVLLFWTVQQQVENHLLVPKVMERQVGISPVTVVVALLVGASLLGIVGALLAVPTAAIVQVVVRELLEERDRAEETRHLRSTA